jgi:hypothetical protein
VSIHARNNTGSTYREELCLNIQGTTLVAFDIYIQGKNFAYTYKEHQSMHSLYIQGTPMFALSMHKGNTSGCILYIHKGNTTGCFGCLYRQWLPCLYIQVATLAGHFVYSDRGCFSFEVKKSLRMVALSEDIGTLKMARLNFWLLTHMETLKMVSFLSSALFLRLRRMRMGANLRHN